MKRFEQSYQFFASKQAALILFLLLCISLIPGTFDEEGFHLGGLPRIVIVCLGLNLILCTLRRIKTLPRPVVVMHLGTMLILAGGVLGSFGFVATVNIYEGATVDDVYRWDIDEDVSLGVALSVKKIETEFYPVLVRVGVLKGQDKVGLFELKTGKSFVLGQYRVRADALELPAKSLRLSIYQGDRFIGSVDTEGARQLPSAFPYDFKLVEYRTPTYKKVGVDLQLVRGSDVVARGVVEQNSPLEWNGMYFYHTALEWDEYGQPYAGIQIVRDPGRPVVFTGFGVMMIGSLLWAYKKFRGQR